MNSDMYESGAVVTVRSFHTMPGLPPPEGERHAHDYRLEVVASRDNLDEHGMVVDIDLLDRALRTLTDRLDGADLDLIVAPDVGAVAVTVELFARWLHGKVDEAIAPSPGTTISVRVWESATAFGGYLAAAGHVDDGGGSSA